MSMVSALLAWLPAFFEKDPMPFAALRIGFSGPAEMLTADSDTVTIDTEATTADGGYVAFRCTWQVRDGTLTVTPYANDMAGTPRIYGLTGYTLAGLANAISAHGFDVVLEAGPDRGVLSALALLDGEGDSAQSNGNQLFGWTNLLFAYLAPLAVELDRAREQIAAMLLQMETQTAEGEWLDLIGGFYAVQRKEGEADRAYGERIIVEVLRPRGNNIAIAMAIEESTGQPTRVTDVTEYANVIPAHNAFYNHDSAITHSSTAKPTYGLFDIETAFDLLGTSTPAAYQAVVRDLVARLRDAGTHLRAVVLSGSAITDSAPGAESDSMSALAAGLTLADAGPAGADEGNEQQVAIAMEPLSDSAAGGADESGMELTYDQTTTFNAARTFSGGFPWGSGAGVMETL